MTDQIHEHHCGKDGWWEERSVLEKVLLVILFSAAGIGFFFLLGFIVMTLWNWLMPDIFGLKKVGYWQAWGLLLLSFILFKSWGSGSSNSHDRKRKRELRRHLHECHSEDQAEEQS
jgi:hypothetical protein